MPLQLRARGLGVLVAAIKHTALAELFLVCHIAMQIAEPEKPPAKPKPCSATNDGASRHPNAPNKRRPTAGTAGAPAITSFFPKREATPQQQQQHEDTKQQQQPDRSQVQGAQPTQQLQQQQQQLPGPIMQGGVQQQQQQHGTGSSSAEGSQAAKPPDPRAAAAAAALARASGSNAAAVRGVGAGSLSHWVQQPGGRPLSQQGLYKKQQQEGLPLHPQQQQMPAAAAAGAEVVDLVSSEEEDDQREPTGPAVGATVAGGGSRGGGAVAVRGATSHQVLLCPVCCAEFQELSLLNAHLDQCLL